MRFNLKSPCASCPFRTDIKFYLHVQRVEEICNYITKEDRTFTCHKTIGAKEEQHCAGALVLLHNIGRNNRMVAVARALGLYDPSNLNVDAPVFKTVEEMLDEYRRRNDER